MRHRPIYRSGAFVKSIEDYRLFRVGDRCRRRINCIFLARLNQPAIRSQCRCHGVRLIGGVGSLILTIVRAIDDALMPFTRADAMIADFKWHAYRCMPTLAWPHLLLACHRRAALTSGCRNTALERCMGYFNKLKQIARYGADMAGMAILIYLDGQSDC